jgi:hypothetical protein
MLPNNIIVSCTEACWFDFWKYKAMAFSEPIIKRRGEKVAFYKAVAFDHPCW